MDSAPDVLRRDYWREQTHGISFTSPSQSGNLSAETTEAKPITMQAVSSVKCMPSVLLDKEKRRQLQNAHKCLLVEAARHPIGTEAARAFQLDMSPLCDTVVGEPGDNRISMPDFGEPYVLIHNHPDGLTFSPSDIRQFINRPNLKQLTAVGNDGTVYCMEKEEYFDTTELLRMKSELDCDIVGMVTADEIIARINKSLQEAVAYGLAYYTG